MRLKLRAQSVRPRRFVLRVSLICAVCAVVGVASFTLAPRSRGASPAAGAISESNPKTTWNGDYKPVTGSSSCAGPNDSACDNFRLTLTPPSAAFGPYLVEIRLLPAVTGDWDMQVYGPAGSVIDGSGNSPGQLEIVTLVNPPAGTYTISAAPFAPLVGTDGFSYAASAEIKHQVVNYVQPGADEISYHNYAAPNGLGTGAGEPSIGVDWKTGRVMYIAGLQTLRVTFNDSVVPARATWENKSFATTSRISLDPILYTDARTGRTFVSQLVSGNGLGLGCSLTAFTDDDGDNWTQSEGCGLPTSGADHQSMGGGPYAAPLTRDPAGPVYPDAVYYCSQAIVAAFCARSDDGGVTFGPGVTVYTNECGGLHGHPMVGADGTVYLPNRGCGGKQGLAVSEDNGVTWNVRPVPDSTQAANDPGVGVGPGGTIYFGYQNGDGHPRVTVSRDHGRTWSQSKDVGEAFGIRNTAFPRVVAGDDDRAAFAFLGTPTGGPFQDANFAGVWHLYISHTYDGGRTWTTVDATPTDPVQRGCIWMQGGSNACRNLLDFMGSAIDKEGRVLIGYADGCTGACVDNPASTAKTKLATIAREVNGRRLFAQYDRPAAPALTAAADASNPATVHLSWTAPDGRAAPVSGYNVYRRYGASYALVATVGPVANAYDDAARDPYVQTFYKVAATSAYGEGEQSNEASVAAVPVQMPSVITPVYQKGGIGFAPSVACRASVATRDGEPSLRVDKFGNAYVAGIRGVPAGVDLWYFDLRPTVNGAPNPTYDPLMRNPVYRGQPDQFSPDEAFEVGADGGGDVDIAVGFGGDENAPPNLAFTSLAAANISTARSTDRGTTFMKNPAGSATGGVPGDDREWIEFYGKDQVYLLYRTLEPAVTQIQRSDDGGLTYGPAVTAGTIGQVGSVDIDQSDGTVYVSGSNGIVSVGVPASPGAMPVTFTNYQVATNAANLFFVVKVADDYDQYGRHLGTAYVTYSDGRDIYLKYSRNKGATWSPAIRVNDGAEARTNLLPWMETGPVPGSVGVVWYATSEASNNDNAEWRVYFAQTSNALDASPVFRQVEAGDHAIHGANISLGGTLGNANRNLLDYFQIAFDPTGAAVIAYTDDHNDFDGHTYVTRQTSGPSVRGGSVPAPVEGSAVPQPTPLPADAPQVTDFLHDGRYGLLTVLPADDPFDIVSVKYWTEDSVAGPALVAQMKVSDLTVIPALGNWRMSFTANAPDSRMSPTGDYSFGVSDHGDQFFVMANTDGGPTAPTYSFGKAARQGNGQVAYTVLGAADAGAFDQANKTITVKVALSKLNQYVRAGNAPVAIGSVLVGLRGGAFTTGDDNAAGRNDRGRSDYTRGGTQYTVSLAPAGAGLAMNFDALSLRLPALYRTGVADGLAAQTAVRFDSGL